jgi:hypothetical protein
MLMKFDTGIGSTKTFQISHVRPLTIPTLHEDLIKSYLRFSETRHKIQMSVRSTNFLQTFIYLLRSRLEFTNWVK